VARIIPSAPRADGPPTTDDDSCQSWTIDEWRKRRGYSGSTFYKLRNLGLAPELLELPGVRAVRITAKADAAWEVRMTVLAKEQSAELEEERKRRVEQARIAGRAGAASPTHVSKRAKFK
jgi:hypothetical protein